MEQHDRFDIYDIIWHKVTPLKVSLLVWCLLCDEGQFDQTKSYFV